MMQQIQNTTDMLVDSISSLLSLDRDGFYEQLYGGWELALATIAVTTILELYSFKDTVLEGVWKQPNGKRLYIQAVQLNVVNHIVLGVPIYMLAVLFCRREDDVDDVDTRNEDEESISVSSSTLAIGRLSRVLSLALEVTYIMLAHSIQYYWIHKSFHQYPALYKKFHRFHHRFNVFVPPVAANAVTVGEYFIAYVAPFAVATLLGRTSLVSLRIAVSIISFFNLLVHTPKFESTIDRAWPWSWWVATNDHLNHHRKLNCHYASPTFNIDTILDDSAAAAAASAVNKLSFLVATHD